MADDLVAQVHDEDVAFVDVRGQLLRRVIRKLEEPTQSASITYVGHNLVTGTYS